MRYALLGLAWLTKVLVFSSLAALAGCSLLFGSLSSKSECNPTETPDRCQGNTFITCQQGILFTIECPQNSCDPEAPGGCQPCGNGILEEGEECDDGNDNNSDGCVLSTSNVCAIASCGDSFIGTGAEECDDGNTAPGDGCDATCQEEFCGDGVVNNTIAGVATEECDDINNNDTDSCTNQCKLARCGDNILRTDLDETDPDFEGCDDGNSDNTDDCPASCLPAFCGDGFIQADFEECDPPTAFFCDGTCHHFPVCGDGFINFPEVCDGGNTVSGDGCDSNCQLEPILEVEPNDDGSPSSFPGPQFATGEDFSPQNAQGSPSGSPITQNTLIVGIVSPGGDDDDFKIQNTAAFPVEVFFSLSNLQGAPLCQVFHNPTMNLRTATGAVILRDGECEGFSFTFGPSQIFFLEILDAFDVGEPSDYLLSIQFAICGDGIVESGESCENPGTPFCSFGCQRIPACGDRFLDFQETCDDGNLDNGDSCNENCQINSTFTETEPNDDQSIGSGDFLFGGDFSSANANGPITETEVIVGKIGVIGDEDTFKIQNDSQLPAVLRLNTFDGGRGINVSCAGLNGFDTVLSLRDSAGNVLAINNDRDQFDLCSKIEYPLTPGEIVFAHVMLFSDQGTIDSYLLHVEISRCGDGVLELEEECEPSLGTNCDSSCRRIQICGDAFVDFPESCDDGNTISGDGCDSDCFPTPQAGCGDASPALSQGEFCDDGNTSAGDGCDAKCRIELVLNLKESEPNDDGQDANQGSQSIFDNDDFSFVNAQGPISSNTVIQGAASQGEDDFFSIQNPTQAPRPVRITAIDPNNLQACDTFAPFPAPLLFLREEAGAFIGVNELSSGDPMAPGCPILRFVLAPQETLFVQVVGVSGVGQPPDYMLSIAFAPCGDGIVWPGEECEDPGSATCDPFCQRISSCGDGLVDSPEVCDTEPGCDQNCQFGATNFINESEPNNDSSTAPGSDDFSLQNAQGIFTSDTVIFGALSPAGDQDCFLIQNSSSTESVFVSVQSLDEPLGNSFLGLSFFFRDGQSGQFITSGSGILLAPNQLVLVEASAGGFFIPFDHVLISQYRLLLDFASCGDDRIDLTEECEGPGSATCDVACQRVPICGDTFVDDPELCEDGNVNNGDGCDENCQVEGFANVIEIEPNDDGSPEPGTFSDHFQGEQELQPTDTVVLSALSPLGDEDVYQVTNPSAVPVDVRFDLYDPLAPGGFGAACIAGSDLTNVFILIFDQNRFQLLFSNPRAPGDCHGVNFTLQPGQVIFAVVIHVNDEILIPSYFFSVDYQ